MLLVWLNGTLQCLLILAIFFGASTSLTITNHNVLSTSQDFLDNQNVSSISNASYNHPFTGRWDAECYYRPGSRIPNFNSKMCQPVIISLCAQLHILRPEDVERNKWVWIELEGCAGAYYVADSAYLPGKSGCTLIMDEIYEKCVIRARGIYQIGSNNVEKLPWFAHKAKAEDPELAMFLLASTRMAN